MNWSFALLAAYSFRASASRPAIALAGPRSISFRDIMIDHSNTPLLPHLLTTVAYATQPSMRLMNYSPAKPAGAHHGAGGFH